VVCTITLLTAKLCLFCILFFSIATDCKAKSTGRGSLIKKKHQPFARLHDALAFAGLLHTHVGGLRGSQEPGRDQQPGNVQVERGGEQV
jgi:hypothetical protein